MEQDKGDVEAYMEDVGQHVGDLEIDVEHVRDTMRDVLATRSSHETEIRVLKDELMAMRAAHHDEINGILSQLKETCEELQLCKRILASSAAGSMGVTRDVPKPLNFPGVKNAKEVDNFLWSVDQYLEAMWVMQEEVKVKHATLYLQDTTMLWWRRRQEDMKRRLCSIKIFEDFKGELKRQFYPENAGEEARGRLRRLKQSGSIRDYVKDFTSLVLEIPDMSDKDSLFFFVDGLQAWAKIELKRRRVQDLASAIAIAEGIINYTKEKKNDETKISEEDRDNHKVEHGPGSPRHFGKGKQKEPFVQPKPSRGCFLCEGLVWTKDCPKRRALNALVASMEESEHVEAKENVGEANIGALQMLNTVQVKPKTHDLGHRTRSKEDCNIIGGGTKPRKHATKKEDEQAWKEEVSQEKQSQ